MRRGVSFHLLDYVVRSRKGYNITPGAYIDVINCIWLGRWKNFGAFKSTLMLRQWKCLVERKGCLNKLGHLSPPPGGVAAAQ